MRNFNIGSFIAEETIPLPEKDMGNYVSIAASCFFHRDDNHACVDDRKIVATTDKMGRCIRGGVKLGNDVWIGNGVSILDGVVVGDGAIIGAHSVVTKNVPDFAVVVGNPARIKRFRFTEPQREALKKIKWWDWPEGLFNERKDDFLDIDKFIQKYS